MYILIHDSPARRALPSRKMGDRTRADMTRSGKPATESDPTVDHDATLLVAALEIVASQQAAIEWLREADLLRLCVV
jgi:hypothetical protein